MVGFVSASCAFWDSRCIHSSYGDPFRAHFSSQHVWHDSGGKIFAPTPGAMKGEPWWILCHDASWIIIHDHQLSISDHHESLWIINDHASSCIMDHAPSWIIMHHAWSLITSNQGFSFHGLGDGLGTRTNEKLQFFDCFRWKVVFFRSSGHLLDSIFRKFSLEGHAFFRPPVIFWFFR